MAQNLPVNFSDSLNLVSLGISSERIKFGSCSMESDKFICVCDTQNGQAQVVIVDLTNNNEVTRRPISAEAAIMNPVSKVIALRAGMQLQIFNMELKAKMKTHVISENVLFWKWTAPNNIAIVTPTAAYHWSIEGDSAPVKVCDRHTDLGEGTQIINYQLSEDGKWSLLIGIKQGPTGTIDGVMQLYSGEKKVSQILNGHSGCFAKINVPGRSDPAQVLTFEEKKPDQPAKLFVMEVGRDKDAPGGVFRIQPQQIPVPNDAPNDFPVAMQVGSNNELVYMISKMGYLYLFDIQSGKALYRARISTDTVFVTTSNSANGGIIGITARTGKVIQISLNPQTLIPFVVSTLRDNVLAINLASRMNLPGAEQLYQAEFDRLVAMNDVAGAAKLASESPQGLLRNPTTIAKFSQMTAQPGQPQPLFAYFSVLLEKGKLNALESMELARPVIQQGRVNLLEKWLKDDKLECSEKLGDLVASVDSNMALSIYLRANAPEKVINCFIMRGEFDKIVAYATRVQYKCDYSYMLQALVRSNPPGALDFAKKLATAEGGSLIDKGVVVDIFMSFSRIQETTAFLLEALKENRQEEGFLQTKLLEINLLGGSAQVADAILQNGMFSYFDRPHIAQLCEQAGLFQRALEHYTDINDIKRALINSQNINSEFIINYFGTMSKETSLDVMREMLGKNMRQNLQLVVTIANKYSEQLGAESLIKLFEDFKSFEGLYYYLGSIVNVSLEPVVHFKYIEAAAKMGQYKEVERVCRDSTVYDPIKVKDFLKEAKLPDPRPLIHVCDRHDFIEEMTAYLHANNLMKYIEVYVTKVSPAKTPLVIGKLLDLDCNEDFIKNLLLTVGVACPVAELVEQVERRNRLRLLQPFLESLIAMGNTETATHNAIGKIIIMMNKEPYKFLANNQFYDPRVLGKFCEKLDPSLSVAAYTRANGECDQELIRITNENGLFKDQARYLVQKQDLNLWSMVLTPQYENDEMIYRRQLIDQVVQTALPETRNPDEVSTTVKAFMSANLPSELIELLERIVLQGSDFSNNRNLQNLLILTAIKADKTRVMEYINRLDNFDGPEIAKIAVGEQYELYEEAYTIYIKCAKQTNDDKEKHAHFLSAVEVLVDNLNQLDRAKEFAERVNISFVWSKLAVAQLDNLLIDQAIVSFIKAKDASRYLEVTEKAEKEDKYESLVKYLKMARDQIKEPHLDTELIYSLSKINSLAELEEFVSSPNVANIQNIGERIFGEGLFEAAKILFISVNNNAKLSVCYVRLKQYREAVDAATKANAISTWKEVNIACLKAEEMRLANLCGLHIIVHPDHLEELINLYEKSGKSKELIQMMEQGLGLEGAHTGIFTELGVLYSKYNPDKLMEHIKIFWSRVNIPKLLRACEKAQLWTESVYLYREDQQFDAAVKIMIDHSICFAHDVFLDCIQKVRNHEIHYKSIMFYLHEQPLSLIRLLQVLANQLDHARVVHMIRKESHLALVIQYLKDVQKENLSAVNEALNELYIDDEDYKNLRHSIDDYDNFDQISLAQKLEKHELLEFRRIAAYTYKKNKRWQQSVQISKLDKMYKDAINTTSDSNDSGLAEELLRFFVEIKDKECFCSTLYTCYTLIRPDVALELAWRNGYMDYAMPYFIQYLKYSHEKMGELDKMINAKKEESKESPVTSAPTMMVGGNLLLTNTPYGGVPDYGIPQPMFQPQPVGFMPPPNMGGYFPPQPNMGGYGGPY